MARTLSPTKSPYQMAINREKDKGVTKTSSPTMFTRMNLASKGGLKVPVANFNKTTKILLATFITLYVTFKRPPRDIHIPPRHIHLLTKDVRHETPENHRFTAMLQSNLPKIVTFHSQNAKQTRSNVKTTTKHPKSQQSNSISGFCEW
jgi:hypothetical protein